MTTEPATINEVYRISNMILSKMLKNKFVKLRVIVLHDVHESDLVKTNAAARIRDFSSP